MGSPCTEVCGVSLRYTTTGVASVPGHGYHFYDFVIAPVLTCIHSTI